MAENGSKRKFGTKRSRLRRLLPRLSGMGANGVKMLLVSNAVLLASLGASALPVLWRVTWVAWRTPSSASPCDRILVLGVKLKCCTAREDYRRRLWRARALWRQGVADRIVLIGGKTSRRCDSEAAAGQAFLAHHGVDTDSLILEERSRHTLENLRHVRELFGHGLNGVIITNRYHLARTAALAKGLALPLELCAAEERFVPTPPMLFKLLLEAYYLHWYYSGVVWARLVGDRKSLERIR